MTLNTPCAQRVYNRVYAEVSRNLYSLGVVTHVMNDDGTVAEELNAVVKDRFDTLKKQLDDEIKRLEAVRDDAGVSAIPNYTEPQSVENDVTTPMTFHFIRLLQTLDRVVTLLDSLWLTEEIDVKQKLRQEYVWQKRILKFSNQLRELNNRARKASRMKPAANESESKPDDEAPDSKAAPAAPAVEAEAPATEVEAQAAATKDKSVKTEKATADAVG